MKGIVVEGERADGGRKGQSQRHFRKKPIKGPVPSHFILLVNNLLTVVVVAVSVVVVIVVVLWKGLFPQPIALSLSITSSH